MGISRGLETMAAAIVAINDVSPRFEHRPQPVGSQAFAGQTTRDFNFEAGPCLEVIQHGLCGKPRVEEREAILTVRYMTEGDQDATKRLALDDQERISEALWPLVDADIWAVMSVYKDGITTPNEEEVILQMRFVVHFVV